MSLRAIALQSYPVTQQSIQAIYPYLQEHYLNLPIGVFHKVYKTQYL